MGLPPSFLFSILTVIVTVTTLVSDTFVNKGSIVQYTDSTVPNFNAVCFRIAGLE